MDNKIQGKIFKFGDNINSDIIIPGRYLIYIDQETLAQHAFEVLGDEYPEKLKNFDIFVAGRNFGGGSAREQAATAILGLGIKVVIASSFARTFYRNAINAGLTIIECPEIFSAVTEGDELEVDILNGEIKHQNKLYTFPKFPDSMQKLLEAGGLAKYLQQQLN